MKSIIQKTMDIVLTYRNQWQTISNRDRVKHNFPKMCKVITDAFGERSSIDTRSCVTKHFGISSHIWEWGADIHFEDKLVAKFDKFEGGLISFRAGDWIDDFIALYDRAVAKQFGHID